MNYEAIATELVNNGADVLDAVIGLNWIDSMPDDVTTIHFMDSLHCPLRYAFGDFLKGDNILRRSGYRVLGSLGFAHPSEFNDVGADNIEAAYHAVNVAWWELISKRREEQDS